MEWLGYVGLVAFALCWIPQSIETIRQGRCKINTLFLILSSLGGLSLALYALTFGNFVFSALNFLTTLGALINLYYKISPRKLSPG